MLLYIYLIEKVRQLPSLKSINLRLALIVIAMVINLPYHAYAKHLWKVKTVVSYTSVETATRYMSDYLREFHAGYVVLHIARLMKLRVYNLSRY